MRAFIKFTAAVAALGSALLFGTFAQAATFSFTSTAKVDNQILVPLPNGQTAAALMNSGSSKVVDSQRGKLSNTFNCAIGTNPPTAPFHQRILCNVAENENDSFAIWGGCNFVNTERTASNCVGGLVGKTGAYEGHSGSITWHGTSSDDGSVNSTGAGVWNE